METSPQKSLERIISHKAMQMSQSFPCKICALGFICGVCITYLFLVVSTPFKTTQLGFIYASSSGLGSILQNSSFIRLEFKRSGNHHASPKNFGDFYRNGEGKDEERISLLYAAWSDVLDKSKGIEGQLFHEELKGTIVPKAPHLEDCKTTIATNNHLDTRGKNGSFPPWTLWRGLLGTNLLRKNVETGETRSGYNAKFEGAYPPWVVGSDEDNFPSTRRVQQDLWMHQHPPNCSDLNLRFLIADWESLPGFGIGAQLAGMSGLLAIAINENRILITNYYNRADHDGCQGSLRSHWSCYFSPETSQECRERAFGLTKSKEAWDNKIITAKENYTSKEIWAGRVPRVWGEPWSYLQPTTDVGGNLLLNHRKMDRRWWRAQAIRYLMRFQTEYTCHLLNVARHRAFGLQAAEMVLGSLPAGWPKVAFNRSQADIEQFVWSNHRPWIPRPLLSMHVRMGDKACEMKVVGFESYMRLAGRIRDRFPHLRSIWLSTEMQDVIDKTKSYPHWNFYYTNVTRQVGNITMAMYEASLGRETSTNYPLVNFIMATEADFFIGALGSTWCYLIDGMRNTGGKVMSGYLSVNKDRFW